MLSTIRDQYLETEVTTATPQRLRLMLIDEALRQTRAAQEAAAERNTEAAARATTRCRNLVSELLAGIQPEQSAVAKDVLRLYMYIYSTLIEIEFGGDFARLSDIQRVLAEEQATWQAVCQQAPDLPAKAAAAGPEELAPARVAATANSFYGHAPAAAESGISIEA